MTMTSIITVPGLGGSGSEHWQSIWEKSDSSIRRVEQKNWDAPELVDCLEALEKTVSEAPKPVVLVAHSLSVSLVVHWAKQAKGRVKAALLVAPADVDSAAHTPEETRSFSPIALEKLEFPSIVVASENDPYINLERAQQLARAWGSEFVNVGQLGHINADSKLGLWPQGQALLKTLM